MDLIEILTKAGHETKLTSKTDEYIVTCPVCNKPKLYVNRIKSRWTCFRCNEGGGVRTLLERFGIEGQYTAPTVDLNALRHKIRMQRPATVYPTNKIDYPESFKPLMTPSASFFQAKAISFLSARGVDIAIASKLWNIGYCDSGRLAGHVIFPILDETGSMVSYQARRIFGDGPKTNNPIGDTGGGLFNLEHAVMRAGVVIVEGPFDAMAVHMKLAHLGISSVALLGHHCSPLQAATIAKIIKPQIAWVMLDPDIERKEMFELANAIKTAGADEVRVAFTASDPDELSQGELLDALQAAPDCSEWAACFKNNL